MKKIKVMSLFGTRPEAIKMAPLIKELQKRKEIESVVCVTGQHREMLDQVLEIFHIKPNFDLNIMRENQTLTGITTRILEKLTEVMKEVKPDLVLVHGDTTTTFAGALAAYYNQIKIGHVEAGLRTYDKYQPFPEEINRKLTGSLADLHFAPTALAKLHLLKENIAEKDIFITGNTVIDVLSTTINDNYKFNIDELNNIDFKNNRVIVVTAHRRENLGQPLINICNSIKELVAKNKNIEIVYAVHKNPVVQKTVTSILSKNNRIHLVDPLNLEDMHNLMNKCYLVMTDSGGLQEEVPSMNKPVIVLRNVTERQEGIEAGTIKLVGSDQKIICKTVQQLLDNEQEYKKMAITKNPFGDGKASKRIVDTILYYFGFQKENSKDYII